MATNSLGTKEQKYPPCKIRLINIHLQKMSLFKIGLKSPIKILATVLVRFFMNKSLDKLIFTSRQNVIRKRKNAIAEIISTPLYPLYRSINFLNLLRSGTKLELSNLFFSYSLIFFKGSISSILIPKNVRKVVP